MSNSASLFFAILLMSVSNHSYAADYYVDNANPLGGDGTSWSTAWKAFADIRWQTLRSGDRIFISGGSTGKTYRETLVVRTGGELLSPVVISRGADLGHDGPVVIDGEDQRPEGAYVFNINNVVIRGLRIIGHSNAGVVVTGANQGIVIEGNHVQTGRGRGIDLRHNTGDRAVVARNNRIETPTYTEGQTDGFWSSNNDGVVIEGNTISILNSSTYGHSDGIQSYLDYNVLIANNMIHQNNSAAFNNHGMWLSNTRQDGAIHVYNNIVFVPSLYKDSAVTHYNERSWKQRGSTHIYHNIIIGGRRALNIYNSPLAEVRNNILQPSPGGFGMVMTDAILPADRVEGNLIWAPSGTVANVQGTSLSWSAWQARGYDRGGMNVDPQLSNVAALNFRPMDTSPAVDGGLLLPAVDRDLIGVSRPQGAASDIGAFEQ